MNKIKQLIKILERDINSLRNYLQDPEQLKQSLENLHGRFSYLERLILEEYDAQCENRKNEPLDR